MAFDSIWNKYAKVMDDKVDSVLGDRIEYAVNGATFATIEGFIIIETDGEASVEGFDSILATRKRAKIQAALIGGRPLLTHRLRHPLLGDGTFRPCGDLLDVQGRYCIFDVQKV